MGQGTADARRGRDWSNNASQLREERKKAREEERQKLLRERSEHIDRNKLREALMAGPSHVHTESQAFAAANAEQGIPPLLTRSMIVHKESPVRALGRAAAAVA